MNFQFDQKSEIENRQCESCGKNFEIDADPMFSRFTKCDPCEELESKELARVAYEADRFAEWENSVPQVYRETRTDHPDYPMTMHRLCQSWLRGEAIDQNERRMFLGLVGESGQCKTRVVSQLVKRMIWDGKSPLWVNSSHFQWSCQNQFNDSCAQEAGQWLRRYQRAPIVIFDDIGSLKSTEAICDNLYSLLEHRTANVLPMIWTSNETIGEMLAGKNLTEKARKRNLSRLAGHSNILEL